MSGQVPRVKRVDEPNRRQGAFTLIELLVVITIITLLIGILVPALGGARENSRKAVCLANLRSIGQGVQSYLNENKEFYPLVASFPTEEPIIAQQQKRNPYLALPVALKKQMKGGAEAFRCPSDRNLRTPEIGTRTYFEAEATSYEWLSSFNGKKVDRDPLTQSLGRMDAPMIWDYEAFHGGPEKQGSHHVLYADLQPREDNWDEERVSGASGWRPKP